MAGNTKKENFMQYMLTESTREKAIKKANISASTAYRWLKDPEFNQQLLELRRSMMSEVTASLQRKAMEAVNVLSEIMSDQEAPDYARISAAKSILDNAYKGLDLEDTQVRLDIIEEAMQKAEKSQ